MDYYHKLKQAICEIEDIPEELTSKLYAISQIQSIKKGEFFIRAGECSTDMGLNLKGLFRFYYVDKEGNDYTKGFNQSGNFLISYSAIVQKRPSFFYIEALQDSIILRFRYSEFEQMMKADFRWYPFSYRLLQSVYIMKELREKSFLLEDATKRYQEFKELYSDVESQIKLYHVASYLGITPEALSRIRNKKLI